MAPYQTRDVSVATIAGPDIGLQGGAVTSFALLLHEFATNAAKHGCLSMANGHIRIACFQDDVNFNLMWTEQGGPPVRPVPNEEGFGTLLSKATARNQLGGSIIRTWQPEGLIITLTVPRIRFES